MSGISTHVLDTSLGSPAAGIPVTLSVREESGRYRELGQGTTDSDGRVRQLTLEGALVVGSYQLVLDPSGYFRSTLRAPFFQRITLEFLVTDAGQHYHVPVLLSPFGYTTYRGS